MRFTTAFAFAFTLVFIGTHASATEDSTKIFNTPTPSFQSASKTFAINRELGRAWVEITLHTSFDDNSATHQVNVPGLSFDTATSAVVFKAEDKTIECATVKERGRWLFKHTIIEPTGRCELTHKYVNVPVDNGFVIEEIQHFEVHFNPGQ